MTVTFDSPPSSVRAYTRLAGGLGRSPRILPSGTRLAPRRFQLAAQHVDLDRLARYGRLCGFTLTGALPATYLHVLAFPLHLQVLADPDFPLPALGLVQVANRITQHRPATVTDRVTLTAWADDLHAHPHGAAVWLRGEAHVDGRLVWEGHSLYLARGIRLAGAVRVDRPDSTGAARPGGEPSSVRPGGTDGLPSGRWLLPADLGRRYAAVSADRNPIHLGLLPARAFGFPRAIAHGMWTHARSLAESGALPEAFDLTARFRRPVLLPSTVDVHRGRTGAVRTLELRTPGGDCLVHTEVTPR